FPMLHGTVGRFLGWQPYSIPVFHLALLTAAVSFFALRIPLDGRGRVLTALGLATCWPLILFLPTSLQEGLHLAVAVFLAAALRPLLDGRVTSRAMRAALVVALVSASLTRPSWTLLLPAVSFLFFGGASRRRQAL